MRGISRVGRTVPVLCIVVLFLAPTLAFPGDAGAAGALAGWSHASRITVIGHDTAGTDVPVRLSFNSAARIAAGTMRHDCADVRIVDGDGRVVPHWLASGCGSSTTRVWFLAARVGPGVVDAYDLYHGNPSASSTSDIRGVLSDTTTFTEGWDSGGTSGWSVERPPHRSTGVSSSADGTRYSRYVRHDIPGGNWGNTAALSRTIEAGGAVPVHLRLHHAFLVTSNNDYAAHRLHFVFDEMGTEKHLYVYLGRYDMPLSERPSPTTRNVLAHERPAGSWHVLDADLSEVVADFTTGTLTSFRIELGGRRISGGTASAVGWTDGIELMLATMPSQRASAFVQADGAPVEGVAGSMAIASRPPCAPGCAADVYGYTSSMVEDDRGRVAFDIDFGAMAGSSKRTCSGDVCRRWLALDLTVRGAPPIDRLSSGESVTVAHLEQRTPFGWRTVPGSALVGTLENQGGEWRLALPSRLMFDERIFNALPVFRLVPTEVRGSHASWDLEARAAQMQLIAAPVLFVHGWHWGPEVTRAPELGEFGHLETALRDQAVARLGQDPWAWRGGGGAMRSFSYPPKQDVVESAHILGREIFGLRSETGWDDRIDLVAHSAGGLVSRAYTEDLGGHVVVRNIVTLNTPHKGSSLADHYTALLDRRPTGFDFCCNPGEFHRHWYVEKDGDDLGHYVGPWFFGWKKWHKESIGAYRATDRQDVLADFQIKAQDNSYLRSLNRNAPPPGVEHYLIGTNVPVLPSFEEALLSLLVPEVHGDGIVSAHSATRGYSKDHCFHVVHSTPVEVAQAGAPTLAGLPFPHYGSLWLPELRQHAAAFLMGDRGGSVCDGQPFITRRAVDHLARWTTPSGGCPSNSCFTAASQSAQRVNWTLDTTNRAILDASAWNGSLTGAQIRLVAPDGTVGTPDAPAAGQVWHLSPTPEGIDRLLVRIDAPADGKWVLEVEHPVGEVDFTATMRLDTPLVPTDLTPREITLGEDAVLRLRLTDDGVPVVSADVSAEVFSPDENPPRALVLLDDGVAPDETAADGEYAARFTLDEARLHPYHIIARAAGATRHAEGGIMVLETPDEAERGCGRLDAFFADPAGALADPLEGPRLAECLDARVLAHLQSLPVEREPRPPVEVEAPERPLVHGPPEAHPPSPPAPPDTPPLPPVPTPNPLACGLPPRPGPIGFILVWIDEMYAWVNCVV